MMVTSGIGALMSFSTSSHERLALQVTPEYSETYILRLSLTPSWPTAGAFRVSAPAERVQLSQVRTEWYRDFVLFLHSGLISSSLLRCGCDLRPHVTTHAEPRKVYQGPPRNPCRHPGMVVRHEASFADDAFRGVSPTMRYAAKWEPRPGNLCGYGRKVSK